MEVLKAELGSFFVGFPTSFWRGWVVVFKLSVAGFQELFRFRQHRLRYLDFAILCICWLLDGFG